MFVLKILGTCLPIARVSQFNVPSLKTLNDWHHDVIAKSDTLLNRYKGGDYMVNFSPLHRSFGYFIIAWLSPWFEPTRFYKVKSTPPSSYRTKICKHALFNKVERYRQDVRRKIKNKYYHIPWVAHRKTTIEALLKSLLSVLFLRSHSQLVAFDQSL